MGFPLAVHFNSAAFYLFIDFYFYLFMGTLILWVIGNMDTSTKQKIFLLPPSASGDAIISRNITACPFHINPPLPLKYIFKSNQ